MSPLNGLPGACEAIEGVARGSGGASIGPSLLLLLLLPLHHHHTPPGRRSIPPRVLLQHGHLQQLHSFA